MLSDDLLLDISNKTIQTKIVSAACLNTSHNQYIVYIVQKCNLENF